MELGLRTTWMHTTLLLAAFDPLQVRSCVASLLVPTNRHGRASGFKPLAVQQRYPPGRVQVQVACPVLLVMTDTAISTNFTAPGHWHYGFFEACLRSSH